MEFSEADTVYVA